MKTLTASVVAASLLFGTAAWAGGNPDLYGSPLFGADATRVSRVQPGQGDGYASVLLDRGVTETAGRIAVASNANPDLLGCPIVNATH